MMRAIFFFAAFFTLTAPSVAFAQSAEASRLIERGMTLRRSGDHAEALTLFEQAAAIEPTARAIAQIGLAHHALGQYRRAREKLIEALAQVRDGWLRTRRAAVEEGLRDSEAHLARISVEGGETGDLVYLGDEERSALPLSEPIFAMPGTVVVSLRRAGRVLDSQTIVLTANTEAHVRFNVAPEPVAAPVIAPSPAPLATVDPSPQAAIPTQPMAPPDSSHSSDRSSLLPILGYSSLALGAAGIGTGIAFHVMRENDASEYNSTCAPNDTGDNCTNLRSNDTSYLNAAIAGYVVGGALVTAGVVLLLLPHNSETDGRSASIECTPLLGSTLGIGCFGQF